MVFAAGVLSRPFSRLSSLDDDPSAIIRATYNRAAIELILENPLSGLGWSNEIFYFPERVSSISHLWEVQQNLTEGDALTAKSLLLRLTMYLGLPLIVLLAGSIVACLVRPSSFASQRDISRTRVAFVLVGLASVIDGGIITSFYIWVAPALCLGFQMRESRRRPPEAAMESGPIRSRSVALGRRAW